MFNLQTEITFINYIQLSIVALICINSTTDLIFLARHFNLASIELHVFICSSLFIASFVIYGTYSRYQELIIFNLFMITVLFIVSVVLNYQISVMIHFILIFLNLGLLFLNDEDAPVKESTV